MLAGLLRSIVGSNACTPRTMSSGLPDGVALIAMLTARRPFISALALYCWPPSSIVATSRKRTKLPFASDFTTRLPNAPTSVRSVFAEMSATVSAPFNWPGAACTLFAFSAAATSPADSPCAASRDASSQTRIARFWPPTISAEATPGTVVTSGCATRTT